VEQDNPAKRNRLSCELITSTPQRNNDLQRKSIYRARRRSSVNGGELQLNLLLIINIINNKLIKLNYYFKSFLVFKYLSKIVPTDFAVVLKLVLKYRLLEF